MLRRASDLKGCTLTGIDGEIGMVEQLYFDDEAWAIRYLVVDTGRWLSGRRILISPFAFQRETVGDDKPAADAVLRVALTHQQLADSPDVDTQRPVSRQHEREYLGHFGFPVYWGGPGLWGMTALPVAAADGRIALQQADAGASHDAPDNSQNSHLRSSGEVIGYHIKTVDSTLGHVDDFMVDDAAWAIRYFVIDPRDWWPGGRKVLLATRWIDSIDWADQTVTAALSRDAIKHSPEYDAGAPISRDYEQRLHEYYDRTGYWRADQADNGQRDGELAGNERDQQDRADGRRG